MGGTGLPRMKTQGLVQAFFYNNPDNYPPIINSVRLLADDAWEVELFCRDDDKNWEVSYPTTVKINRIKCNGQSSWQSYWNFIRAAIRNGRSTATAFIGHDMHGFLPARLLATRNRRPVIYHCHDFSEPSTGEPLGGKVVRRFERAFARSAAMVIIPDAERAAVIREQLNLPRDPLIVANAPLRRTNNNGDSLRRTLSNNGRDFEHIVLRQGKIGPGHAIEATIRSMPLWKSSNSAFVVMGLSDAGYLQHLKSIASELNVQERFVVLPAVGYDRVSSFTKEATIGHALYEPIHINNVHITTASNKIMEYMAAGLPLLLSDTPALRRLAESYGCGVVADETQPTKIAEAINELLANEEESRRMGTAAANAFETRFRFDLQFRAVMDAMNKMKHGESNRI